MPAVAFGYADLGWFFFSTGMLFWAMLMTIVFYRILFHEPLPKRVLPTLYILIAPPAVGFLAYTQLVGELDAAARMLYFIGLFLTLLLLTRIHGQLQMPFTLSWWAYTFPLAAISLASMEMTRLGAHAAYFWIGVALLLGLSALVAALLVLTVRAALKGTFCRAEEP